MTTNSYRVDCSRKSNLTSNLTSDGFLDDNDNIQELLSGFYIEEE